MWQHACLVLATAAAASSFTPFYTQDAFPQVMYSSPHVRAGQDQKYDCPNEGFFVNPKNCSQFYRCVDYTKTGYVYSVYAFECPRFMVFLLDGDNSTCVPGTECYPGTQTASHVASSSSTTQRPSETTSGTSLRPLTVRPTAKPTPVTSAPVTSAPVTTPPVTVSDPAQTPGPAIVDCRGQYVQHDAFCNVYYKCDFEADKFLCPAGSVFDTVRQMCRIQAADEDLCGGKSIYSTTSFRYVNSIPLGSIGSRTHLADSLSSFRPQQFLPQSQANYLAYFNPRHPLRMNPHQTPFQYIQPITSQFTQGHSGGHNYRVAGNVVDNFRAVEHETIISHPEPDTVHPHQYHHVVDGEMTIRSQPEPESVHPRQYFRVVDENSQYEPENPRQYFRVIDENRHSQYQLAQEMVHPRQYFKPVDSELDASEFY